MMTVKFKFSSSYPAIVFGACTLAATSLSGCALNNSIDVSQSLMPHGYCLAWNPQLLTLFVVGNLLIAASYFSIPAALWIFILKRKDLAFIGVFRLFAAFIFLCGTTHIMKLVTIWTPSYWAEAVVDLITGLISVFTAITLWPIIPKALALRSPQQWEEANAKLQDLLEQQIQTENALRENQELLAKIIQSANDAFISIDTSGSITDWNSQAEQTFGWSRMETLGHKLTETIIPIQHREAHSRGMKRYFESGEGPVLNQRVEMTAMHKSGHEFPVELSIFPVKTQTDTAFCAFIHDITARRQSEKVIRDAHDAALRASLFKSEFLAHMSHEIRTPMNGILGMTEILLKTDLDDTQRSYADTVKEAGKSLVAVINDVLDFSKIEAGKLFLETVDFEPIQLVESVAELLVEPAKQKGLSLLTFIDPNISSSVRGDPGRLRQVLMNLVGNAIKFSEQGEILVRAIVERRDANVDFIKFSVTDKGIGLTEEEVSQLFEPFVQLSGAMSHSGTGLGLSISKRLVNLMGGEIGVHSVKDHGSTFWTIIPFERNSVVESNALVTDVALDARVLVVDDETTARAVLQEYFESWSVRIDTAKCAKEALEILTSAHATDPYNVVLIDYFMPEINGLQLGKAIRENKLLKNLKLILVTGFDSPGTGEEAISLGFNAYLKKPLKQSLLLDCMVSVLGKTDPTETAGLPGGSTSHDNLPPVMRGELILVVEDHLINQEVALLLLKSIGFECHIANNGRHALELMQRIPYALVFMDCQMPELNGFETTRAIRKNETRTGKHIPIIAMTAHAIEGSREQCLSAGMDDYISKPVDPDRLQKLTDKWLPSRAIVSTAVEPSAASLPESSSTPEPPIDFELLESRYGTNAEKLIGMFVAQAPIQLGKLKEFADTENVIELLWCVHGLKGICVTVFALPMRQVCDDIESAAQRKDWKAISALIEQLSIELDRVKETTGKSI